MTDIQAWLDEARTLADKATEGPWFTSPFEHDPVWGSVVTGGVDEHDEDCPPCIEGGDRKDAAFIADARTRLPQALNALQAVLDLHQNLPDVTILDGLGQTIFTRRKCSTCSPNGGINAVYPCPTVRAIQDAIKEQSC